MPDSFDYAERLFPEPVDLGIAEPDRAVASVEHGTRSFLEGQGGRAPFLEKSPPCAKYFPLRDLPW